ncbi:DUF1631 family protein [Halioxenophilus aromaticivorans]|uniref:DUF1631 family protein n=1 Tax=Halioxenophilus aromaticivorans TaxID=1306992 RepID=A0AAV3TWR7_9ALTE
MADNSTDIKTLSQQWSDLFLTRSRADLRPSKERFSRLVSALINQTSAHEQLKADAKQLSKCFAAHVWAKKGRLQPPCSTLASLAELHFHLARWQPNKGRVGKEFPKLLANADQLLRSPPGTENLRWQELHQTLVSYSQQWQTRRSALENRQLESLVNLNKITAARCAIAQQVNTRLSGSILPAWLNDFIKETLVGDLAAIEATTGETTQLEYWLYALDDLCTVYCQLADPTGCVENQQAAIKAAPGIIEQFSTPDLTTLPGSPQYLTMYEQIVQSMVECVQLRLEPLQGFSPITVASNVGQVKVSSSVDSFDCVTIECGQWFEYHCDNDTPLTFKLFHLDHHQSLAHCTDYYGKITLTLSADELQLMMAARQLVLVPNFLGALSTLVQGFLKQERSLYEKSVTQIKAPAEPANSELGSQSQNANNRNDSSQEALLDDGSSSHHCDDENTEELRRQTDESLAKIDADINRLSQDQKAQAAEIHHPTTTEQAGSKSDEEIASFQITAANLQLGAWVKFKNLEPELQKLSLKMPSSDKYLFTDRLGRKAGEYRLQQLVNLFADDKVKIVSLGERFDSRLEAIVKNQRRK